MNGKSSYYMYFWNIFLSRFLCFSVYLSICLFGLTFSALCFSLYHILLAFCCSLSSLVFILDTGPEVTAEACYGIRTVRCDHCSVTVKNLTNLKKHMEDYHGHLDIDTELQRRDPLFLQ